MRKLNLALLMLGGAALTASAADTGTYYALPEGVGISLSPSGQYVIGFEYGQPYSSFVMDLTTKRPDWFSNYASSDEESGRARGVNDNGTVVGDMYDPDFVCEETDIEWDTTGPHYDVPLHTAFVYKDGIKTKLDHCANNSADWDSNHENPDYYKHTTDGSYAVAINNEETLILGYLNYCGYSYPCYWEWDDEAQAWGAGTLAPQGEIPQCSENYYRFDWTPDGARAIFAPMYVYKPYQIYTYGQETVSFSASNVGSTCDAAISPDGKLMAFATYDSDLTDDWHLGLHDFETGETQLLALPQGMRVQLRPTCVTNDRKIYFYLFETSLKWAFYVCDFDNQSFVSIDSFVSTYEIEDLPTTALKYSIPIRVSDDGKTILASYTSSTQVKSSYVITLPDYEAVIPSSASDAVLFYSSPSTAAIVWSPVELSGDYEVDHYLVTVDDVEQPVIEPTAVADGKLRCDFDLAADGQTHTVNLYTVVKVDDKEYMSEASQRTVCMSADTSCYFFEDVDSRSGYTSAGQYYYTGDTWMDCGGNGGTRYYDVSTNSGTNGSVIYEGFSYGVDDSGEGNDCYLTTRFLDATNASGLLLTFSYARGSSFTDLPADETCYFAVECANDGYNWERVFSKVATDMLYNAYSYELIDISQYCGDNFQVRFVTHNGAAASYSVLLDYVGVIDPAALVEAPAGLTAIKNSTDEVTLAWKGSTGEYQVSYCPWQWSGCWYSSIGPDTESLIVAVDITPEMLEPYVGMYMNSVFANVYDSYTPVCKGQAIIYEMVDGTAVEIAREEFANTAFAMLSDDATYMPSSHCYLSEPKQIEAGKTYRVALRIYDYASGSCPIWYSSTLDGYSIGVTDLYSEDEGLTWGSLTKEFGYDDDGEYAYKCILPLRLGIVEEPSSENPIMDSALYAFDVLRNGEKINERLVSFTEQQYTDEAPLAENAAYQVRAYYRDGRISDLSEALNVTSASVKSVESELKSVDVKVTRGLITLNGPFEEAALYTVAGQKVLSTKQAAISTTGMTAGVYVLRINTGAAAEVTKVLVK
ncbi:MAG: hypothetical protein LIP03_02700 [Bacteroidales bacterium]|nr:hypothetical protein [Bacteroidales bacterium]